MNNERHGEAQVLYAPRTTRRAPAHRTRSPRWWGFCRLLLFFIVLGLLWLSYKIVGIVRYGLHAIAHPYHDAFVDKNDIVNDLGHAMVRPLLQKDDPVRLRATVWLDVTQHLRQGHTVPTQRPDGEPIPLISYNVSSTADRTDAVLFDGIVFEGVMHNEHHYTHIPLSIPIKPLYTQFLGPATLRVTYTIDPPSDLERDLGRLTSSMSIFPPNDFMLPRSPISPRIQRGCDGSSVQDGQHIYTTGASTLAEALEHNGASAGLLALLPSNRRWADCRGATVPDKGGHIFSFIDNSPANRNFTNIFMRDEESRPIYYTEDCTIMLPHVRAQSRVYLRQMDRAFDVTRYALYRDRTRKEIEDELRAFKRKGEINMSKLRSHGPLETMLTFEAPSTGAKGTHGDQRNGTVASVAAQGMRYYYAPTLLQRTFAAAPRAHHLLPRLRTPPTVQSSNLTQTSAGKQEPKPKDGCARPILQADASGNFFPLDLEIRFGVIGALRGRSLDSLQPYGMPKTEVKGEDEENEVELTSPTDIQSEILWELMALVTGDQFHPRRRPWLRTLTGIITVLWNLVGFFLTLLYWYTRTTVAGLSLMAQWLDWSSTLLFLTLHMRDWWQSNSGLFQILLIFMALPTMALQASVLLRIEWIMPSSGMAWWRMRIGQRPESKAERDCRRSERTMGWVKPSMIVALCLASRLLVDMEKFVIRSGHGCLNEIDREGDRLKLAGLDAALGIAQAGHLLQFWFNVISPALLEHDKIQGRRGQLGSFAGKFKLEAWFSFSLEVWNTLLLPWEFIGGHSTRQDHHTLSTLEHLVMSTIEYFQAVRYRGIPAVLVSDEDEDDEEEAHELLNR